MTTPQAPPPTRLDAQRPWPGLSSFAEADSAYFFGRERETRALLDLVERSSVVVLYGQSGLGKTSLLQAGLFPALKATDHLPVWVRLDFGTGAPELAAQVLGAVTAAFSRAGVEAPAPAADESIWSYFHRADADFWGARNRLIRPLIVLDQFEEMFTLGQRDAAAAERSARFARELEAQIEQRPPPAVRALIEQHPERAAEFDVGRENVRFIVSLREDFLPHLDAWRDRMPSLLARRYRLEPMTRAQALQVVRKGGAAVVDDAVAEEIVAFVAGGDGGRHVEPAILSVVCEELNARRLQAGLPRITRELLSGERGRIIADFYARAFDGVPDDVRDWVEDELLTASGHRDRAALEDARRAGLDTAHLERLVGRRVLHSDERHRVVWVEFTHDLLTQPAMQSRIERERRRTEADAARREAQVQDQLRRSRRTSAAFGVMALAMAGLTWWSFQQRSEANQQRLAAEQDRKLAEQQTLLARAQGSRADAASQLAKLREAEAEQAASAAQRSASQAEADAERARQAEAQARANLSSAEATALQVALQGVAELERQWVDPTFESARIVAASIANVDPLVRQFADVAALQDARQRLYALATLVLAERGDVSGCMALVQRGGPAFAAGTPRSDESAALLALGAGHCDTLRGEYSRAGGRFEDAARAAQRMPAQTVNRHRILVRAALGASTAARQRYDFDRAEAHRAEAQRAVDAAARATGVPADELQHWRLALLSTQAVLARSNEHALEIRQRLQRELAGISAAKRDTLAWRGAVLGYDLERAESLWYLGQLAQAEALTLATLEGFDRWLVVDPTHVEHRLRRTNAARMHAEILHRWRRRDAAAALIRDIESQLAEIGRQQPAHINARYQLGVLAWLRSTYTGAEMDQRQAQMEQSARSFEQLVRDKPDYAVPVRSWAVALRDQGELALQKAQVKDLSEAAKRVHQDQARAHFEQALQVLARVNRAADRDDVGDLAAGLELKLGELALAQDKPQDALGHFQRASRWHRGVQVEPVGVKARLNDAVLYDMYVARALRRTGRLDEAERTDQAMLAELEPVRQTSPGHFDTVNNIAWVHRMAASDHLQQGRLAQALRSQAQAARIVAEELRRDPLSRRADQALASIQAWMREHLRPAVEKARDPALTQALSAFDQVRPDAVVAAGVDRPRSAAPPIPGDWQHLELDPLLRGTPTLAPHMADLDKLGWRPTAARRLHLPFYQDSHLLELDVQDTQGRHGVVAFVARGDEIAFRFNGTSKPIHDHNRTHALTLRTEEQARQYLRYFLSGFDSEEGMFRFIDVAGDLMWEPHATPAQRQATERRLEPLRIGRGEDGTWTAQGSLQWGGKLFLSKLTLERDGTVEMLRDKPFTEDLPLATARFDGGVRMRDGFPALPSAIQAAANRRDWKAAADDTQALVDSKRKRLPKSKLDAALPGDLLQLAWYRVLAREPQKALDASMAGLAVAADNIPLQTNRAHALLLLGRQDEAMAIYREHIGKRTGGPNSRLWQDEILNDLSEFAKAGLDDPRFAAVRSLMEGAGK